MPLKSLAQPDNQEQMNTPGVGDSVSMQVDATVTRIDGDNAYVKPSAVNGTPLDAGETDEEEAAEPAGASDPDDSETADLRKGLGS